MRIRHILEVSFFTFLSRILGLLRDVLLARYLGAGAVSDAFFVAFKLPNLFRKLFAEGSMQSAFIPIFSTLLKKDTKAAQEFSSQVFTIFFIFIFALVIFLEIFTGELLSIISPGFKSKGQEVFDLAVLLTRLTLPYLFFISLVSFYSAILNSVSKFALVAFLPFMLNVGIIASIYFYYFFISQDKSIVKAAAFGVSLGGVLQLCLVFWAIRKAKWLVRFVKIKKISMEVRDFFKKILPVTMGAGFYQVNIITDILVASFLNFGAISYLFYADRIYQLPLAIIGIAIGSVLLPYISGRNIEESNASKEMAITIALAFSLPASLGLLVFSADIIHILFYGGEFTLNAVSITGWILFIYAISLPFNILIKIILPIFYSHGDTKTPLFSTVISIVANIFLVITLAFFFSYYGIALATTLASIINFVVLLYFLKKKYPFRLSNNFKQEVKNIIRSNALFLLLIIVLKFSILEIFIGNLLMYRIILLILIVFSMMCLLVIYTKYRLQFMNQIIKRLISK